jgi:hypothetical protein
MRTNPFPPRTLHPVAPKGNHGHSYSINLEQQLENTVDLDDLGKFKK